MTIRDELYQIIDRLPEEDLVDAHRLLAALEEQERGRRAMRSDPAVDAWQREAIREGVAYAERPDSRWVRHEDMARWLDSWGSGADELPPPTALPRA